MQILSDTGNGYGTRLDARGLALSALVAASLIFCYSLVFGRLLSVWWNNSVYSHGFLVPLISLYLVWLRRDALRGLLPSPSLFSGLTVLSAGLGLLVLGHAGGISVIQEISLLVTVSGIVLLLLGSAFFKVLWFPIAYLMFMLRFFEIITARLHEPFQNISAFLGTELIQFLGIPAYRESVYIELPRITLEVAEVCSGVNYLIAVFAIGVPLAYVTLRSWPRRVLLVSASVVIAVLSNGLRVALIGVLSYHDLAGDLHGPYHMLQAMFTSFVGFIVLFAGAWFLSERRTYKEAAPGPAAGADMTRNGSAGGSAGWYIYLLTAALLVAAGSYVLFYRPTPVPIKKGLANLPYMIDEWRGSDIKEPFGPLSSMEFDDHLSRTYRGPNGEEVKLHIGYFMVQAQGRELVNYMTGEMHAGAERSEVAIPDKDFMVINRVMLAEGRRHESVSFWYEINGRSTAGRYHAKVYTTWRSLVSGRSNGAVIVVRSRNDGTERGAEESFITNEEFIKKLVPELGNHIPSSLQHLR